MVNKSRLILKLVLGSSFALNQVSAAAASIGDFTEACVAKHESTFGWEDAQYDLEEGLRSVGTSFHPQHGGIFIGPVLSPVITGPINFVGAMGTVFKGLGKHAASSVRSVLKLKAKMPASLIWYVKDVYQEIKWEHPNVTRAVWQQAIEEVEGNLVAQGEAKETYLQIARSCGKKMRPRSHIRYSVSWCDEGKGLPQAQQDLLVLTQRFDALYHSSAYKGFSQQLRQTHPDLGDSAIAQRFWNKYLDQEVLCTSGDQGIELQSSQDFLRIMLEDPAS